MKRPQEDVGKTLDLLLSRYDSPSPDRMQSAIDRVGERLRSGRGDAAQVSGSTGRVWKISRIALAVAAAALLLAVGISALIRPPASTGIDAHAVVRSADGSLSRVSGDQAQPVHLGDRIERGEVFRANDTSAAVVLADGSSVELRPRTRFSVERAEDGIRIHLKSGGLIVNAAKQVAGHLYVQTKDITVSVVGTVFLVNAEEEGSRVAVIEGEVRVQQGATTKNLLPGEQMATSPQMESLQVKREVSWSPNAETHVALLQQSISTAGPKRQAFEVVSIKREPPTLPQNIGPGGGSPECRGVDGRFGTYQALGAAQGRCTGRNVSLMWLIAVAYGLDDASAPGRIVGLERWMQNLWDYGFQIDTKAENPATATKDDLRQMLQSMLADRFKLQVTKDIREIQAQVVTIARGGSKLQEASGEESLIPNSKVIGDSIQFTIAGKGSVASFLDALQPYILVDQTSLKGMYAFNFSYTYNNPNVPGLGGGGARAAGPAPGTSPRFAELRDALQKQLGLQVESGKVSQEFIVIEHAEMPSEN